MVAPRRRPGFDLQRGRLCRRRPARDDAGASTTSARGRSAVAPPDTTPPTAPTDLSATPGQRDPGQPELDRLHANERLGARYRIERCSGRLRQPPRSRPSPEPTTTFEDSGLNGTTYYTYRVSADDAVGDAHRLLLERCLGDDAGAARHHASDRPRNLDRDARQRDQVNLCWSASTDATAASCAYRIERCTG